MGWKSYFQCGVSVLCIRNALEQWFWTRGILAPKGPLAMSGAIFLSWLGVAVGVRYWHLVVKAGDAAQYTALARYIIHEYYIQDDTSNDALNEHPQTHHPTYELEHHPYCRLLLSSQEEFKNSPSWILSLSFLCPLKIVTCIPKLYTF